MSITPSPTPPPQDKPSEGEGSSGYASTSSVRAAWLKSTEGGAAWGGTAAPLWAVIALAVVSLGGLGGMFYYAQSLNTRLDQVNASLQSALSAQGETLEKLGGRLDQGDTRATELQGQVAQTQNRLGLTQSEIQKARQAAAELVARQQQQAQESAQQAQQLSSQLGQLQQEQVATKGNVGSLTTDVAGVKGEVKTTKDELAATRSELQRVIGDLGVQSDLVAHNRTELQELILRGEREYVEFDLSKRSRLQKIGNIRLELKRTDPKKQKYTVNLVVDDRTVEKKDKNVFEPVQFYQEGFRAPTEIVVNKIEKDRVVGYVSAPKKREDRAPMRSSS